MKRHMIGTAAGLLLFVVSASRTAVDERTKGRRRILVVGWMGAGSGTMAMDAVVVPQQDSNRQRRRYAV